MEALDRLKVDNYGLDQIDIEYLESLIYKFNGGPVGVETIASSIGEEVSTLEDVVEPYLMQEGFLKGRLGEGWLLIKVTITLKEDYYNGSKNIKFTKKGNTKTRRKY